MADGFVVFFFFFLHLRLRFIRIRMIFVCVLHVLCDCLRNALLHDVICAEGICTFHTHTRARALAHQHRWSWDFYTFLLLFIAISTTITTTAKKNQRINREEHEVQWRDDCGGGGDNDSPLALFIWCVLCKRNQTKQNNQTKKTRKSTDGQR